MENTRAGDDKLNTPGKRIRALRNLCSLSRKAFSTRHSLSEATLRSIELDLLAISEKTLKKIIAAFAHEDIVCSSEWIMSGAGVSPFRNFPSASTFSHHFPSPESDDPASTIGEEISCFLDLGSNRIVECIKDNRLSPIYKQGDYVGGIHRRNNPPEDFRGKTFIIKTRNNGTLIGSLIHVEETGITVFSGNIMPGNNEDIVCINRDDIVVLAPVIWHRIV